MEIISVDMAYEEISWLKWIFLKLKLTQNKFSELARKARMYDKMIAGINILVTEDVSESRSGKNQIVVARFTKSKTIEVDVDVERVLAGAGYKFSNEVKWKVTYPHQTNDL